MSRNYNYWATDDITCQNQKTNKKAIKNQEITFKLIDDIGGLKGKVLDIGDRNVVTSLLEEKYNIKIENTTGDLDEKLKLGEKDTYDFVHYNNVIEHQFNPLLTLIQIKEVLKKDGLLILGTPLKPKWITSAKCHFHEFDEYTYINLINRAGFEEIKRDHFYKQYSIKGIRNILGSFYNRQVVSILKK